MALSAGHADRVEVRVMGKQNPAFGVLLGVSGAVLAGAVVTAAAGVGVLAAVMAKRVVTPPKLREDDTAILAVDTDAGTITLESTADSVLPGEYSLWFSANTGHARVGEIVARSDTTVTRRLLRVDYGDLSSRVRGRLGGWLYLGPEDLGFPFQNVLVPTGLGQAPAWLVPAEEPSDRWVIQVHGRAVRREETLRAVPVFREAGYNSLLVSYRNDGDAPASSDGRYGLGDTEWLDVEAAIAYAARRGATDVVLMGWSMGGAIVLHTLTRTSHSDIVSGVVLESPVVDWADVVAYQAVLLRLPKPIAQAAMHVMGQRWGGVVTGQAVPIDFSRLDFLVRAEELNRPILLMHSDDDGFVPANGSRALAALRSDLVTFVRFDVARHTKLWNYDKERWELSIRSWLSVLTPSVAAQYPAEAEQD